MLDSNVIFQPRLVFDIVRCGVTTCRSTVLVVSFISISYDAHLMLIVFEVLIYHGGVIAL